MTFDFYRLPEGQQAMQQRKILYMGLYLLIWGEGANVRFMETRISWEFCATDSTLWQPSLEVLQKGLLLMVSN